MFYYFPQYIEALWRDDDCGGSMALAVRSRVRSRCGGWSPADPVVILPLTHDGSQVDRIPILFPP